MPLADVQWSLKRLKLSMENVPQFAREKHQNAGSPHQPETWDLSRGPLPEVGL